MIVNERAAATPGEPSDVAAAEEATAAESYEPTGGNIYRPHRVMVDPGTFWRCAHGLTTLSEEFLAKGCPSCAAEDPVAFRASHGKTATAAESVTLPALDEALHYLKFHYAEDEPHMQRITAAAAGQATPSEPVKERGPWTARTEIAEKPFEVFVESDDFTHDVRLYVSGDFRDNEQRLSYAGEIARRLNAAGHSSQGADR